MNDKTTKSQVRRDFQHARHLMREADRAMKSSSLDLGDLEVIANELLACTATFHQWIEEQREEVSA